jgi:N-acylglucosamine-6-phosphate 2-epimerase
MARLAVAAQEGGARAIRANTPDDIAAIRKVTDLPIIGLWKVDIPGYDVYITPLVEHAAAVMDAGADIVAIDATCRPHPEGETPEYIQAVKEATGALLLADISTYDEAIMAKKAGADFISTTMSGYTPYSPQIEGPDLELVAHLAKELDVIAEGRISSPEEAVAALNAGALSVIVGGAITRPAQITARYVKAISAG